MKNENQNQIVGNIFSNSFLTFNMLGSIDQERRRTIQDLVKHLRFSILATQETGMKIKDEDSWKKSLRCKHVYFNESDNITSKGGVGLCFADRVNPKEEMVDRVKGGRALFWKGILDGLKIIILNIHMPNAEADQLIFLEMIHTKMRNYSDKNYFYLLCGDLNLTRVDQDRIGGSPKHKKRSNAMLDNILEEFDLVDTYRSKHKGPAYTWRVNNVARRLDYFFTPRAWEPCIKEISIIPNTISDHQILLMKLETHSFIPRGPGTFKVNNQLLEEPEFIRTIKEYIAAQLEHSKGNESPGNTWEFIKFGLIQNARVYAKARAARIRMREDKLNQELVQAIEAFSSNVNDENTLRLQSVENEMKDLVQNKTKGAILRSRLQWLNSGEKNTRYFLRSEQVRAEKKTIHRLRTEDGMVRGKAEVQEEIHRYFSDLYRADPPVDLEHPDCRKFLDSVKHKQLQGAEYEILNEPITALEIEEALKRAPEAKSPGIDSLSNEMLLKFWPELKDIFMAALNESFKTGLLTTSQRKALVTLIPKGDPNSDMLKQFRGISLLCCDFKLISSVLTNRMKRVIGNLIDEEQTGFIKGRQISENICMIRDIMDYTEREGIEGYLAIADLQKAFDQSSFEYTEAVFKAFNFPPNFCRWMKILRTDTEKQILNNGWCTKSIHVGRSTPQGSPESPYTFLLLLETFAAAIKKDPEIRGIKVQPENIEFKNSHFCDDSSFLLADKASFQRVFERLETFGKYSGLTLNRKKTVARGIGTLKNTIDEIAGISVKPQAIKTLGYWLSYDQQEEETLNFDNKIDKIAQTLSPWTGHNLSLKGKALVAKVLGVSQITYQIISGIVPARAVTRLERILQQFMWNRGSTKIARNVLIQDYVDGGIKQACIPAIVTSLKAKTLKRIMLNPTRKCYLFVTRELKKNGNIQRVLNSNFTVERLQGQYSSFYTQVLKEYQKASPLCCLPKGKEVLSQRLLNNNWISFLVPEGGRKSFYNTEMHDKDLFCDWVNWDTKKVKSFEQVTAAMINPISKQVYTKIRNAIPKRWWKVLNTLDPPDDDHIIDGPIKFEYIKTSEIQKLYRKPSAVAYYARHITNFDEADYWELIAQNRIYSSKTFQSNFRLLHASIITHQKLHFYGIMESPFCLDCQGKEDTIKHALLDCFPTWIAMNEVVNEIFKRLGSRIALTDQQLLLGVRIVDGFTRVLASLLSLAKRYIINYRYQRTEAGWPSPEAILIFAKYHLNLEYLSLPQEKKQEFYELFEQFL